MHNFVNKVEEIFCNKDGTPVSQTKKRTRSAVDIVKTLAVESINSIATEDTSSVAGLSSLRQAVSEAKAYYDSSSEVYDPICVGFLAVPEIADGSADLLMSDDSVTNASTEFLTEVSAESFQTLLDGFTQAGLDDATKQITILDGSGRPFIIVRDGNSLYYRDQDDNTYPLAVYDNETGKYSVNMVAVPANFDPTPDDAGLIDVVPTISVVNDLISSQEINTEYGELCDVVLSDDPQRAFTAFQTRYANSVGNASEAKIKICREALTAFLTGGWSAVIALITKAVQAIQSLADNGDGTYSLTDNSALVPKQYIAGAVLSFVGTAGQALSMVLTIINKVVGILVTILTTTVSMIGKIVSADHSDTYASYADAYGDDVNSLKVVSCCPFAIDQGTATSSFAPGLYSLFQKAYSRTGKVSKMLVPGGAIIFGPSGFDENGSPTGFNYEFHPFSGILKNVFDSSSANKITAFMQLKGLRVYKSSIDRYIIPSNCVRTENAVYTVQYLCELWKYIMDPSNDLVYHSTSDSSVLSSSEDEYLRKSIRYCLLLYMFWATTNNIAYTRESGWDDDIGVNTPVYVGEIYRNMDHTPPMISAHDGRDMLSAFINGGYNTPVLSWVNLINQIVDINASRNSSEWTSQYHWGISFISDFGASYWTLWENKYFFLLLYSSPYCANSQAMGLASRFKYEVKVPQYDATTFWLWISLGIIGAAVIATGVALVSMKVSKKIRAKRLKNRAKFSSAQDKYTAALQGNYTEYEINEETGKLEPHEYHVDPQSAEGQALINSSFRELKHTSFTNNVWAGLIGGTRYDYSSFWGEKELGESTPLREKLQEFNFGADDSQATETVSQNMILHVITGE